MKKVNFIKKGNKKLALFSVLFLILSCSNSKNGTNSESKENMASVEQVKPVSQEELQKYTKNAVQTQDAFVSVHNAVKDSIVNIRTKKTVTINTYSPLEEMLYGNSGGQEKREASSLGSGFVVSKDGYVVTNNHVVDGADEIYVKFSNGREYRTKLVGTSPEVDIAVLKIDLNGTFKPLEFANSDQVQIGQWSIAFGNPLGLNDSMTVGIVSAAGRSSLGIEQIENFIQTDAAINQGNSGGPLIDITGKVIGVNTAIYSQTGGSVGIGFAIPANLAMTVKDSIIATGKFERPYIGVYLGSLDSDKVKALNLKSSNGVFVLDVVPNGPAAAAGITKNDVIIAVDGKEVNSSGAFVGEIAAKKVGQNVKLTVIRNGKTVEVGVKLIKTPNALQQQQIFQQRQQQQQQQEFGR